MHELKHDGFRILALKDGDKVRLWSRNGRDWSSEFICIASAMHALPLARIMLDGEAVAHCLSPARQLAGWRAVHAGDVLVYSGYSLESLVPCLERFEHLIDALITDPFRNDVPQTLALRGSDNQRLVTLTPDESS